MTSSIHSQTLTIADGAEDVATRQLCGGVWGPAASGRKLDVIEPATGRRLASIPDSDLSTSSSISARSSTATARVRSSCSVTRAAHCRSWR